MKPPDSENSALAGSSEPDGEWLTASQIVAVLSQQGVQVTERQLERWRNEGLLPRGRQVIGQPGRGSIYRFPPETVPTAREIVTLLKRKADLTWVGHELWWRGFELDESHWREPLLKQAKWGQPVIRWIAKILRRERNDDYSRSDTLGDRVAPKLAERDVLGAILATPILGRFPLIELPSVLAPVLEAAGGFDPKLAANPKEDGFAELLRALDIKSSKEGRESGLLGSKLQLHKALSPVMRDIACAMKTWSLADAATAPSRELTAARNDFTLALQIAPTLYESSKWLLERSTSLRFASWISHKCPPQLKNLMLLIWVLLRRVDSELLTPQEVEKLHQHAQIVGVGFRELERLSRTFPEHKFLRPKQLRKAFNSQKELENLLEKIRNLPERD